jgi:hypothetical protein
MQESMIHIEIATSEAEIVAWFPVKQELCPYLRNAASFLAMV